MYEGRPNILDFIKNGEYDFIINTTEGRRSIEDSKQLRRSALQFKVAYTTTMNGAYATCEAFKVDEKAHVRSLQSLHKMIAESKK